MRLALDPRARRLLRRLPRMTVYSATELVLLSLLAVQCARLVWAIATPVGPVGDWKAGSDVALASRAGSALGGFDPFFRLSGTKGPVVVTSLDLKLFGVREDQASGRGSAIIGTPDGRQRSFAVGDEIVPGVRLTAVGFDNVTISRGGVAEQLFLDQSPGTAPAPAELPPLVSAPVATNAAPAQEVPQIRVQPRLENGRVAGLVVMPGGSGDAFRAAGFAPGDVIVSVNGQHITSADQARAMAAQVQGAGAATIVVNRDGRMITLRVGNGR